MLGAFGKLRQKVLWKWETEVMDDKPSNVMLHKWLPQQDVLGHPNVKLFVSHGGQSSFQETICHQTPAVSNLYNDILIHKKVEFKFPITANLIPLQFLIQLFIPVQGDQPANAKEAERLGIGLSIPFQQISEESIAGAVKEILDDPKYTNRAKALGSMAVDQLEHPLQRAAWWFEHIMKYPEEYVRKSPVHKLAWYQYFCIDVIITLMLLLSVVVFILYKIIKLCCFSRKSKSKSE